MKVLISVNSAWNLLNFRVGLIKALLADGHTVVMAAPTDEHVPALQQLGASFIDLPMRVHGTNPIADLALIWRFVRLLRHERPDVLLSYTPKPNVYGSLAAHGMGIKVVNNITGLGSVFIGGGWLSRLLKHFYTLALGRSHRVFFQNQDDLTLFLKLKIVTQPQTAVLPGSGVDLEKFKVMPLPCLVGTVSTQSAKQLDFVFLLVARMLKDKGVEEYVQAARAIKATHPHTVCALLGFIDSNSPYAIDGKQIQAWVDEGVVNYWGSSSDVRLQLAKADCVVLPSYREGTPRTLLEAAAMGRPLIATDVPGCREVVRDGVNGLLCLPKDAKDLAKKMSQMICFSESKLQQMSCESRQWVEDMFDEKLVIDQYRKTLNAMIKKD